MSFFFSYRLVVTMVSYCITCIEVLCIYGAEYIGFVILVSQNAQGSFFVWFVDNVCCMFTNMAFSSNIKRWATRIVCYSSYNYTIAIKNATYAASTLWMLNDIWLKFIACFGTAFMSLPPQQFEERNCINMIVLNNLAKACEQRWTKAAVEWK